MQTKFLLITLLLCGALLHAEEDKLVFRKPFTLELYINKEHSYSEKFPEIPYTDKGSIYLFKGDEFGVNLNLSDGTIKKITYQPDLAKADVTFHFTQEIKEQPPLMMLVIKNNTKERLFMDSVMTMPGKKGISPTSILPIDGGLSDYESWPHPIIQLVLRNLRLKE
ncbi:MAG: hypothetical protein ABI615_02320 [Chthoniobacterales bacterium]